MAAARSVNASCAFVVTPYGHEALRDAPVCNCVVKIAGALLLCPLCETVYGRLSDVVANLNRTGMAIAKRD